ncbi:MAG TPA: sigma-70 family RNA polymerase sigma factor [Thermoanaerobaculia bacterium]|jgi:RNA polymerase sigma factor (sigma-70 family)|nr:sigma-70 family RNA polymerase sigma factor [Thermoanaerobaculia bacterium]
MEVEASLAPHAAVEGVLLDRGQRSRLVAYARARFGLDSDAAEDLLQETAIELLRLRTLVRSPRGFVFTVFHARCCRYLRHMQAERRMFSDGKCAVADDTGGVADPEELDSRLLVQRGLEEISASCRKLLHAYYVEGRSLRESADAMALAYSGVWKTINRCLKKLRACLA